MGGVCSGRPLVKSSNKQKGQSTRLQKYDNSQKLQAKFASDSKTEMIHQGKGVSKNIEESPVLGRSRTLNLKKAVEIVGKSVSSLKSGKEFVHGGGTKISILSFEVANIIGKGQKLLESLSEKKIGILQEVLSSEGIQNLVSTDINVLLMIAAADKREEFDVFVKEVTRFGDLCKDPQLHNLGPKLDSDDFICNISKEESEATMRELRVFSRHTAELYHEMTALHRLEHDYKQKLEEVNSFLLPPRGDDLEMLKNEVKLQRKFVNSLKKKSLWFKNMEEIMVKLLDVASYLNQRFIDMSENNGGMRLHEEKTDKNPTNSQPLGPAGLALHYANIIIQIHTIASSPTCLPPKVRDSLYCSLPDGVKTSLRSRLRVACEDEQLGISHIKDEMDKTSKWLVPAATNTIKLHQKFGWVGDWAMSSKEKRTSAETIRLQTLYHADKAKTEMYILEQVTRLHHLIKLANQRVNAIAPLTIRPSTKRNPNLQPKVPPVTTTTPNPMNSAKNKLSRVCPLGPSLKAHQAAPDFKIQIAVGQFKF